MESLKPTSGSVSLTRRSSRLAGDQAISISDDQTSDTSGGTARKYGQRRRMKRTRQACDDEVDDIFLHLNGLKRTASEDFHGLDLNSDTKLALHKALAAGTAVKEYSNRGKLDKSAKGLYLSNNMGNKNGRESGHVLSNSEDGDDDCVITKYVPSCAICPTCHRRKPMKNINVRPASEAPKRSSLRSTPNVPTSSVKPAPAGRNRFIGNQVNLTDDLSRPPFMESLESKVIISISKQNSEKGFEAIERATQDINKSSVLLVSPSSHDNQSSLGVTANTSDQVTTQKISSSDQQAVGDIIENFTSQSSSTRGSASVHTSFFTSSVQKIVQLLSPPTSETTLQHSQGAVTSLHRLGDVPQQPDEDELPSEVKMSVLPMPKASPPSSKVNHELPNDYLKSNEVSGFPFPFRTPAVEKTQNEFAQLSVSHPSASLLKDSQTETEVDSKSSVAGLHVTTLTFSKSDPKKTVFEAALDHGYQLRSSGSAMIHQCLASY